jgi:hypothetical protein
VGEQRRGDLGLDGAAADSGRFDAIPAKASLGPFESGLGALFLVLGSAVLIGASTGLQPRLGAAALLAVIGGLVILLRPTTAVLAMMAMAPVICGLKRGLLVPGLRPSEVLMIGLAVPVLLLTGGRSSTRWRALDTIALAYVVATLVLGAADMLVRGDRFTAELNGKLIGPLQFFLYYRAIVVTLSNARLVRRAMRVILLTSIPVSIITLLQFFNVGPTRALILEATDSPALRASATGLFRASGIMEHWHSLGGYMIVIALLCVALLLNEGQDVLSRRVLMTVLAFATVAIVATLTLVVIAGTIVGAIGLGMAARRTKTVLAWLAIGTLISAVSLGPFIAARLSTQFGTQVAQASGGEGPSFLPQTIRYRVDVWTNQYLPVVTDNLLTGYGPGLPPNVNWEYTESVYITILLRGGVPLLATYAALMIAAWSVARYVASRGPPAERSAAQAMMIMVLVLVPMQFINPYFTNTGLPHILWALFGVVAAAAGYLEKQYEDLPLRPDGRVLARG